MSLAIGTTGCSPNPMNVILKQTMRLKWFMCKLTFKARVMSNVLVSQTNTSQKVRALKPKRNKSSCVQFTIENSIFSDDFSVFTAKCDPGSVKLHLNVAHIIAYHLNVRCDHLSKHCSKNYSSPVPWFLLGDISGDSLRSPT